MGTGGMVLGGDCCNPHVGVGCEVPVVMECVCGIDPFCCENNWDQICANEAVSPCGATCGGTGGSPGVGGAPPGTGGLPSAGGSLSSGGSFPGTGGIGSQCDVVFPDSCGNCLCKQCFSPLSQCFNDDNFECLAIFACVESTGCSGIGCYQDDTCKPIIDAFGGLTGDAATKAIALATCGAINGCACD
jgi:hypothetical protein